MNDFEKKEFKAVCSACKKECTVPFEPKPDREVFCRDCYRERRSRNRDRY